MVLQRKQKVFQNLWTKWNNLKPCRSWNFNFHQNKNHPSERCRFMRKLQIQWEKKSPLTDHESTSLSWLCTYIPDDAYQIKCREVLSTCIFGNVVCSWIWLGAPTGEHRGQIIWGSPAPGKGCLVDGQNTPGYHSILWNGWLTLLMLCFVGPAKFIWVH